MEVKNIILDFGHGGVDNNGHYTTAPSKMYKFPNGEVAYEGQLNREIGGKVYRLLKKNYPNKNIKCTVSPNDSRDLSLSYRVRVANQYPANDTIFVSIHSNAGGGTGFEIFTTRGVTKSDKLAEDIADEVEKVYKNLNLRLRYDFSDGDKDKEADFYVLRKTKCPAVLLECLFFDNYEDFQYLKDEDFQGELAYAIYKGVSNYINYDS